MKVRRASLNDLDTILDIYEYARSFMASTGNPNQWKNNRPSVDLVKNRINSNDTYVITDEDVIKGVFVLIKGADPTYNYIEGGWLNECEYVTVHQLASAPGSKGIFDVAINYAKAKCSNVRIDTHEDNKIMQHLILKHGFRYCGVIYVDDGTPRLAYQFVRDEIDYSKYKLFIVDYDGTTISSMEYWNTMMSTFVKSNGFELKEDVDKVAITHTNKESAQYLIDNYFNGLTIEQMEERMLEFCIEGYKKLPIKRVAKEMLNEMKRYGRVVLFSATSMPLLEASLKSHGITYFDCVYSASELGVTKKDGSGFKRILELEGYDSNEALVVEDAIYAILGARMAGIDVMGVEDSANQRHLHEIFKNSNIYKNM